MARGKSKTLTDAELRLMDVLWQKGSATVADVAKSLKAKKRLAYTTVLTTLRILEDKGYVRHEKRGRAFVYFPVVEHEDARRSALRQLVDRFFNGSPEELMLNLIEQNELDAEQLRQLREEIEQRS